MAVTSINITRVSTNLRTNSLLDSLRRNTLSLFQVQNNIATGNRLNALSDNPALASKALNLTELLERQEQILANIRHADSVLAATDHAIGSINNLLLQARDIASEMVNGTVDQAQRDSSAELVLGLINELVRIGNRQYDNIYLFGGQQSTRQPFTQTLGGVEYVGDLNALLAHVDLQQQAQVSVNGQELFGSLSTQVKGRVDLDPILTLDTRLADLKGAAGRGIQRGAFVVSVSVPATNFTVDLSQTDTIGDVLDAINAAAAAAGLTVGPGQQFEATLNPTGNGIQLNTAFGNVTVQALGESTAARDLGILGAGPMIVGQDLQPRLKAETPISALFGGAGAALGSIQIINGPRTEIIDLSGAQTIQDVLNKLNTAGLYVRASINEEGTGIDVVTTMSGLSMFIGEAGGNTAELLGLRSLHGGTPLSSLNNGRGVSIREGLDDFRIIARDGQTVDVNLDGARTIQDVLDRINAAAAAAGVNVTAGLATNGNGIQIIDTTGGAGVLRIERLNLSAAIDGLGLTDAADPSSPDTLTGADVNPIRANSVFTALIDLYDALRRGDTGGITDAGGRIGEFITRTTRVQGMVGARAQAMATRLDLTEAAVVATTKLLSDVKDLDYTEAITRFQMAQTTLQANLLTGSRLLQLSLMDFIR